MVGTRHVTRVARYIKSKRPSIKLFIWHDMISQLLNTGYHNVSRSFIDLDSRPVFLRFQITELVQLVIPMVWAYVDDVKPWFDSAFWMRLLIFLRSIPSFRTVDFHLDFLSSLKFGLRVRSKDLQVKRQQ